MDFLSKSRLSMKFSFKIWFPREDLTFATFYFNCCDFTRISCDIICLIITFFVSLFFLAVMTMMMAKCFAKGCTHKTSSEKNNTGRLVFLNPSSIYSCSIGHIWEHEFCHLGCWAVKGKFLKRRNFCLSMLLFGVVFLCFQGQKNKKLKKLKWFSVRVRKLHRKKVKKNKKKFGNNFFGVKNRLPLTIFWSEIVSVIHRGA